MKNDFFIIGISLFGFGLLTGWSFAIGVSLAAQWGTLATVCCATLLDRSESSRKMFWKSVPTHIFPLVFAATTFPTPSRDEAFVAIVLHAIWFAIVDLDERFNENAHILIFVSSVIAEVACGALFE